jgi:uncharacterized protein YukE
MLGEPKPIKEGALPEGAPQSYGGRDAIRDLVMRTRPEEFGGVAGAYDRTAQLLDRTIKDLSDYASRLVADDNWGGESARAMLGRMARVQSYLGTLRSQIGDIPPSVQQVGRELASAKERFEQATQEQYATVDTGSYISRELSNDPDADAQRFLAELNGRVKDAHGTLPERLPWDAELASSAPYMPAPSATPLPNTATATATASTTTVANAATPPVASPLVSIAPTLAATTPGQVQGTLAPTGGTPSATHVGSPTTIGLQPVVSNQQKSPTSTEPTRSGPRKTEPLEPEPLETEPRKTEPTHSVLDERPTRTVPDQARGPLQGTGPSVRPGVVPVVDGSWHATAQPSAAAGSGGTGTGAGGMPFMPMGGGQAGYDDPFAPHRQAVRQPDDSGLFRPAHEPGQSVVE